MINGKLRTQIDRLWEEFWTGGITNPLTVIEQISFLMFARLLDLTESRNEKMAEKSGKSLKRIFPTDKQHLRWSSFRNLDAESMLKVVRDEVFPFFKTATTNSDEIAFSDFMADAQLMIQKPSLLVSAVNMVHSLPLTEGDTKGDLYEYLLSKLTTAGINGQFRTPRHIIRLMVEMIDPQPNEFVADPACGTAGFLVETMQYLQRKYTSPEGVFTDDNGNEHFSGDLLEDYRDHIQKDMFRGFDFDVTMLRIAAMNMMLHGVEKPDIRYQDTLSNSFIERYPQLASSAFDVVLANPPFTGSLDAGDVHVSLIGKVKTKKTELLFLSLILRMLKQGGRSATIVPEGVLFGSSKAHLALRKMMVEENQLEAVISLPSGVFKPYAGVSTAVVVFTKGGQTDKVFYYDVRADGFSLDDKRTELDHTKHDEDNLLDVLARWRDREIEYYRPRTSQSFFVPKSEIAANNYDLSFNKYREMAYEQIKYDRPENILADLTALELSIQADLAELGRLVNQ